MTFTPLPLTLYQPAWNSELASTIVELEKLRVKQIGGPVPSYIFFQLKNAFQMMESLGSARIEGNRTTLAEFVEKVIEGTSQTTKDDTLREIINIDQAIKFIEETVTPHTEFNRALISEIHKLLVDGLTFPPAGEGSRTPGVFRSISVSIKNSLHVPPDPVAVAGYMEELFRFVNEPVSPQNDLLVTALAHHRMAWIHPFDNGNGRAIRMFTYAMLIRQGFKIKDGRILNPTAIFCMDRNEYYDMLALADTGEKGNILRWCRYVLTGLREEIEKIDLLLDLRYITDNILIPALDFSLERRLITEREHDILRAVVKNPDMSLKSADLERVIGKESSVQRSRILGKLKEKGMLRPLPGKSRVYTIGFSNNYLLRGVFFVLEKNGFVPASLNRNEAEKAA